MVLVSGCMTWFLCLNCGGVPAVTVILIPTVFCTDDVTAGSFEAHDQGTAGQPQCPPLCGCKVGYAWGRGGVGDQALK
jgi:hypothetical protein